MRIRAGLLAFTTLALSSAAVVAACGSSDEALDGVFNPSRDGGASSSSGSPPSPGVDAGAPLAANSIVLVHAADFGPFRLCFESDKKRQPIPSADLMPDSNLVGVDVGSVVRIDPLPKPPGKVWAFAVEGDFKSLYPPGKGGPTCADLLGGNASQDAIEVGTIADDLSTGVHLLVLTGSKADLKIARITLSAYPRGPSTTLPVQVLPLSGELAARAGDAGMAVTFGDLADAAAAEQPIASGALPFGNVTPSFPTNVSYDPTDEPAYATTGFSVTLGIGDGGANERVLAQSLADVQRLSAPRALPADYYAAASSYVLLLLGGATADAGAADGGDERALLHFLAVPLAAPDAGAKDGGDPPPADASLD